MGSEMCIRDRLYQKLIDKQMKLNEMLINDIGILTKEIESITIYINKLNERVKAVEILFNNINEINYINKEINNEK